MPVRVGVSIGDTLASLHGVIGVLMALQERHTSGRGQVIDMALYEAVFNCMESLLPEYSAFGAVREPAVPARAAVTPEDPPPKSTTSTPPTKDDDAGSKRSKRERE